MPSADGTPPRRPGPATSAASLPRCSPSSRLFASKPPRRSCVRAGPGLWGSRSRSTAGATRRACSGRKTQSSDAGSRARAHVRRAASQRCTWSDTKRWALKHKLRATSVSEYPDGQDLHKMKTAARVISALALAFVVGVTLASANGQDVVTALRSSLAFASIAATLVALLSFGMEKAVDKGYPAWLGLLLVVLLNVLGLVILTLLPARMTERTLAMSGRR